MLQLHNKVSLRIYAAAWGTAGRRPSDQGKWLHSNYSSNLASHLHEDVKLTRQIIKGRSVSKQQRLPCTPVHIFQSHPPGLIKIIKLLNCRGNCVNVSLSKSCKRVISCLKFMCPNPVLVGPWTHQQQTAEFILWCSISGLRSLRMFEPSGFALRQPLSAPVNRATLIPLTAETLKLITVTYIALLSTAPVMQDY